MRESFYFQKKLAGIADYLFCLGCANIAANRVAVQTIEEKLKGTSESKISKLAQDELKRVVKQLKNQEDILNKQAEFQQILKANTKDISNIDHVVEKNRVDINKKIDEINSDINKKLNNHKSDIENINKTLDNNKTSIDSINDTLVIHKSIEKIIHAALKKQKKHNIIFYILSSVAIAVGIVNLIFMLLIK